MLLLKEYQQRALDALRVYFADCARLKDGHRAYENVSRRTLGVHVDYREAFPDESGLEGLPYVCLRIPTGGGKTLVACHAVSIAARDLLHADAGLVLWLVPSNAIRHQTLIALRDRSHPYRQALDATCGRVNVMDVAEALYVTRASLDAETTIIVSTMQAFRVEDTEGRKVYEDSGYLMGHFAGLPSACLEKTQKFDDGTPVRSLANILCVRRPIVIVDEAHNSRTPLSFDTLRRFDPSCIIEFTATPDREKNPSNVLQSVSAAELKAEQMIKMPIRLEARPDWKDLLADATACLNRLEETARLERQQTGEYLRPIMLIQAQAHSKSADTLSVETVKEALILDYKIPEEEIAIATGAKNEIEGVELRSPQCRIRYIITMQALREGWDCPFAYILCSIAETRSTTCVEQILGRLMRLPQATPKQNDALNMAYAFVSSPHFGEAARMLVDGLVQNGFERQEARDLIIESRGTQAGELFDDFMGTLTLSLPEVPKTECLSPGTTSKIVVHVAPDGETGPAAKLTFQGVMTTHERDELQSCLTTDEAKARIELLYRRTNGMPDIDIETAFTPIQFSIPVLAIRQGSLLEQFEDTHLIDHPWDLSKCDALLERDEYSGKRSESEQWEIDVTENGKVTREFISRLQGQMLLFSGHEDWSVADLVRWLDKNIPHGDIPPAETGLFLTHAVQSLIEQRRVPLEHLIRDKYRLKEALINKIDVHRSVERDKAYQLILDPSCETPLVVSPELCLTLDSQQYAPSTLYRGGFIFKKHLFKEIGDLSPQGEEFECAQYIDGLDAVEVWVRNLERRSDSFWLQTRTHKFYPDFVCKLKDGRCLVVEYKGEHLLEHAKEKEDLGELWEKLSDGQCLFVMPTARDFDAISKKIATPPGWKTARGAQPVQPDML
jgi:type III restriction enzyme